MDHEQVAAELVRALRGKRSQAGLSKRLGHKSNVLYTWESQRGWPTAARFLQVARKVGVDLDRSFRAFYRVPPGWLSQYDPATPEGVAAFLDDLRGNTSIVDLAHFSGKNRFAVARWLKGSAEPRLPDFLLLIQSCSLRLLDFLGCLVDPSKLPSVTTEWAKLQVARRVAYDTPWSQAVLRALELRDYAELPRHELGWIAARIGIAREQEIHCLRLLAETGQIRLEGQLWVIDQVMALDTRSNREAAQRLKAWWGQIGVDGVKSGAEGFVYNLFGVSRPDLERLRELQKAYFTELRSIVAQSEPVECVVLATSQLLQLSDPQHHANSEI